MESKESAMTTVLDAGLPDQAAELKSANEPGPISPRAHPDPTPPGSDAVASLSSGPSSIAQESLSSASSFQSLSSKSSSGICADSAPDSPDKSYENVDIPDLDDLINACANVNLGKPQTDEEGSLDSDHSQDQTFTSAAEDTILEETQPVQPEDTLRTFKTCTALEAQEEAKAAASPRPASGLPTSVLPYVSFEESVLRKHQEKSEEFQSALTSFQLSLTGGLEQQQAQNLRCSPTPCIELDAAAEAAKQKLQQQQTATPVSAVDKLKADYASDFGSPDVSFKEVAGFDATVLIPDSDTSTVSINSKLNATVLKSPIASPTPLDANLDVSQNIEEGNNCLNKTQDVIHENHLNVTQDVGPGNLLNETQDVGRGNLLNETQDILEKENNLNVTQDIVKPEIIVDQAVVLNQTQDIVQQGDIVNIVENIQEDVLNSTQDITKQENISIKTDDIENQGDILNKTQEIVNQASILNKTQDIVQQENILTALDAEIVASTPLPTKDSIKEPTTHKTSNRRSSLFPQDANVQINNEESAPLALATDDIKVELEQTIAVNEIEDTKSVLNRSLNLLPADYAYDGFKPQKQSTTLPYPPVDLQEVALSLAKDLDASIEQIEQSERFVSANEIFGDPSAFDFLNQLGSEPHKRSDRYDSLYMKFDPLAQRLSMLPQKNLPSTLSVEEEEEKVVKGSTRAPSLPSAVDPTNLPNMNTPKKNPALAAIDRLLFYSPTVTATAESEPVAEAKQKKEVVEKQEPVAPVIDEKMAKELELVRSTVLQLEAELEQQRKVHREEVDKLNDKLSSTQSKLTQMQSQLAQEITCKDQMTVVVEEYEKSISRLVAEREKDRTNFEIERAKLQEELQVSSQHLSNTEAAFSDVHSKYERLKNVVAAYKTNEGVLKASNAENQETIKTLESRYEQLKSHAMAQLEKANLELNTIRKQNEAENMKLKALVRRAELKSKSLEETVEQKIKENNELTKIIDEMIARVE